MLKFLLNAQRCHDCLQKNGWILTLIFSSSSLFFPACIFFLFTHLAFVAASCVWTLVLHNSPATWIITREREKKKERRVIIRTPHSLKGGSGAGVDHTRGGGGAGRKVSCRAWKEPLWLYCTYCYKAFCCFNDKKRRKMIAPTILLYIQAHWS